jgi:hypothetical protein
MVNESFKRNVPNGIENFKWLVMILEDFPSNVFSSKETPIMTSDVLALEMKKNQNEKLSNRKLSEHSLDLSNLEHKGSQ